MKSGVKVAIQQGPALAAGNRFLSDRDRAGQRRG